MVILDIGKDVGATTSVTYTIKTGCDDKLAFNGDGCDWLKIEKVKGTGEAKDSVKFTVTKANEGNERKCYITPVVGDWSCDNNKFIVRQQPGEPEPSCCEIKSSVSSLQCSGSVTFSTEPCGTSG